MVLGVRFSTPNNGQNVSEGTGEVLGTRDRMARSVQRRWDGIRWLEDGQQV